MGSGGRRVSREKRRKLAHRIEGWPVRPRRTAAVLVTLFIALSGVVFSVQMEAEFDRAGEAVRTQEHQWSIIVDKDPRRRGGTRYYVLVDGRKEVLDDAGFLSDKSLYAPVWYVVDPEDEFHLIAVGSPGDWEDKPWNTYFGAAVLAAFALVAITSAWWRIVPEDRWVVLNTIFPSKRPPGRRALDLAPRTNRAGRLVR